jgi:hypothetical protein
MVTDPGAGAQSNMNALSRELAQADLGERERPGDGEDHYSHAAGRICQRCDQRIEARQPARRKGADGWVHDICPPMLG